MEAQINEQRTISDASENVPVYRAPDEELRKLKEGHGKYGVMYSGDYEWSHQECTRRAYGDSVMVLNSDERSLYFHTPLLPKNDALACIRKMPERYNDFHREHTIAFVEALPDDARISVSRESSPALYVWLPGREDDGEVADAADAGFGHYTDSYETFDGETKHRSASSRPDEYSAQQEPRDSKYERWSYNPGTGTLVRMWWD